MSSIGPTASSAVIQPATLPEWADEDFDHMEYDGETEIRGPENSLKFATSHVDEGMTDAIFLGPPVRYNSWENFYARLETTSRTIWICYSFGQIQYTAGQDPDEALVWEQQYWFTFEEYLTANYPMRMQERGLPRSHEFTFMPHVRHHGNGTICKTALISAWEKAAEERGWELD